MKNHTLQIKPNGNADRSTRDQLNDFFGRLVPLCDGRIGLRGGLTATAEVPSDASQDSPVIDFVASTEAVDRYGEVIRAEGWRLDNYRRNPVFQNAHQYGDILFTLGRALITEVRGNALYQRVEFATEVNPMARIAYGLYRGKFLNAVSVGFLPLRWENGGENSPWRRRHLEQELVEVSAVGIPANPEALQLALRAGAIARADLRELLESLGGIFRTDSTIEQFLRKFGGHSPDDSLSRIGGLLQLARAAREAMRRA